MLPSFLVSQRLLKQLKQVWCFTEAMVFGLCLGALWNVPIENYKFLIEVPFTKEKSPCPFKYEVSGLLKEHSEWSNAVKDMWREKLVIGQPTDQSEPFL